MADEELHETDSNNQKDWQSETSSSTVADETASKDTEQNAEKDVYKRQKCRPPISPPRTCLRHGVTS